MVYVAIVNDEKYMDLRSSNGELYVVNRAIGNYADKMLWTRSALISYGLRYMKNHLAMRKKLYYPIIFDIDYKDINKCPKTIYLINPENGIINKLCSRYNFSKEISRIKGRPRLYENKESET